MAPWRLGKSRIGRSSFRRIIFFCVDVMVDIWCKHDGQHRSWFCVDDFVESNLVMNLVSKKASQKQNHKFISGIWVHNIAG